MPVDWWTCRWSVGSCRNSIQCADRELCTTEKHHDDGSRRTKLTPYLEDCPVELETVYVEYQAYPFQEGDERFWVYTTGSGSIIQKLLDGYRKESK